MKTFIDPILRFIDVFLPPGLGVDQELYDQVYKPKAPPSVKFRQVRKYKSILAVLGNMHENALCGDINYFITDFMRQCEIVDPDDEGRWESVVTCQDPHSIKMWVVVDEFMRSRTSRPAALITRLDHDNIMTICVYDAGDFGRTPEVIKQLCLWCDQYEGIRFHAKDDRVQLLAKYGNYDVAKVETIYLATRREA